jgi:AraC-like DNA-binding protein
MASIDGAWLDRLIDDVQELSLAIVAEEQHELPSVMRRFSERLAPAPDSLHQALLANLMLDVCRHTFDTLHASLPLDACTCAAESWSRLGRFTRWYETDPRTAVCTWTEAFFVAYRRNHPPTVSTRAAAMMRLDPARPWAIGTIARALGVTRRHLSTEFRARYGVGPLNYLHLARISKVLLALDDSIKIEALALEVGYRSKKDFYRAFRVWTGMTPTALRAMPTDARKMLKASLRARCLWGDCPPMRAAADRPAAATTALVPIEQYRREYAAFPRVAS